MSLVFVRDTRTPTLILTCVSVSILDRDECVHLLPPNKMS